jgi:hypothetical protein
MPAPTPLPAPLPGYATLSGWVALLVVALGALPTTLFVNSSSTTLQIVGLIVSAVTAIITHTNVTSLRRAHVAYATAHIAARNARSGFIRLHVMAIFAMVGMVGGGVLAYVSACKTAGQVVLQTGQCVLDSGVLATVLKDLVLADYAQLIAQLETTVGPVLVTCALQAIAAGQTTTAPSDGGATPTSAPTSPDDIRVTRARELLAAK